jgi:hypothetical protein
LDQGRTDNDRFSGPISFLNQSARSGRWQQHFSSTCSNHDVNTCGDVEHLQDAESICPLVCIARFSIISLHSVPESGLCLANNISVSSSTIIVADIRTFGDGTPYVQMGSVILISLALVFGAKIFTPRAILLGVLSSSLIWQVRERATGSIELGTISPIQQP